MEEVTKDKKVQRAVLVRLQKWCGLRDRSEREARLKMREWMVKMPPELQGSSLESLEETWIAQLHEDGFLDERRCAESYTRIHLVQKGWGPLKIKAGLMARGVSSAMADEAISEISNEQWLRKAVDLARRRRNELSSHRDRVIRWLLQRGFPQQVVWAALEAIHTDTNGGPLES